MRFEIDIEFVWVFKYYMFHKLSRSIVCKANIFYDQADWYDTPQAVKKCWRLQSTSKRNAICGTENAIHAW